jgi:hypothetical protein
VISARQRLLTTAAHPTARSDGDAAPDDAPDHQRNRRGLAGNPGGFGLTKIHKHSRNDGANYGTIERLRRIRSEPIST